MTCTPEYIADFARRSGIDVGDWRVRTTEAMLSVSGIRHQGHATALRDYLVNELRMQAEINEPVFKDGTWGVVAIPVHGSQFR